MTPEWIVVSVMVLAFAAGMWWLLIKRPRKRATLGTTDRANAEYSRRVFDMTGGSLSVDGLKVRNHETVFDLDDVDLDARNIDVK